MTLHHGLGIVRMHNQDKNSPFTQTIDPNDDQTLRVYIDNEQMQLKASSLHRQWANDTKSLSGRRTIIVLWMSFLVSF